jgi:uncharacterized repeat protein (TIGR01451 family)
MGDSTLTGAILAPKKFAVIALAAVIALSLALSVVGVALQTPDFSGSYKTGPAYTRDGDVIAYTILAVNTGESVEDVLLSDTLPLYATFIAGSCIYRTSWGPPQYCGPMDKLWQEDLNTGTSVITTFNVKVTRDTTGAPLINCAHLSWDGGRQELCFETVVDPGTFLPFLARNAENP